MTRRLFLTGPIGCGKSTAIEQALGHRRPAMGGFLTRRVRGPQGKPLRFELCSPDGQFRQTFLDLTGPQPAFDPTAFSQLDWMKADCPMILDEIGGIELLCSEFSALLTRLLEANVPILGVIKGEAPAKALVRTLGLSQEYELAAAQLRQQLQKDPETLVYSCTQFDPQTLELTAAWAKEFLL